MISWGARSALRSVVGTASRQGTMKIIHPPRSAPSMTAANETMPSCRQNLSGRVCLATAHDKQGQLVLPSVANVITRPNIMIYKSSNEGDHSSGEGNDRYRRGSGSNTIRALLLVHRMWQPHSVRRMHYNGGGISANSTQESIIGVELTDVRRRWKSRVVDTTRTCGSTRSCMLSAYLKQRGFVALGRAGTSVNNCNNNDNCSNTEHADNGGHGNVLSCVEFDDALVIHDNHLLGFCLDKRAAAVYVHKISQLRRLKPAHIKTLDPHSCFMSFQSYEWDTWREVCREPGWQLRLADESMIDAILRGAIPVRQLEERTYAIELYA